MSNGPGASEPSDAPAPAKRRRVPEWLVRGAQLFALSGVAIAQPVFDLLGNNAAFFVAHDASTGQIVLLTFVLLLVPPAIALGVVQLLTAINREAGSIAMLVAVGAFAAFIIVPPFDRALGFSTVVYLLLVVVVGVGVALLYRRFAPFRTFTTFLSAAPILFAIVFLFFSQVGELIFADDAEAYSRVSGLRTPVVMLVLDEFTLGSIVDEDGQVDAERFPNLAELADSSTWYRRAGSPSGATTLAVPALLSGTMPSGEALPTSSQYPRNIFTMLGRTHELEVDELVTDLCPDTLCGESASAATSGLGTRQLFKDAGIVYLHQLLPEGLADSWLPTLGERWANFDDDPAEQVEDAGPADPKASADEDIVGEAGSDQAERFDRFLDTITPRDGGQPPLYFLHELLPHIPYTYLPDGDRYANGIFPTGVERGTGRWPDDDYLTALGMQQYMLQTEFTDREIGRLIERLKETGLWDDALVVVTADHGVSFQPGGHLRGKPLSDENRDDIMPVPLFVKYPNQDGGRVDDRFAQTTDILPTIADTLGVELPDDWARDGVSLLGDPKRKSYQHVEEGDGERTIVREKLEPEANAARFRAALGASGQTHDLYRVGPHGDLVGRPVAELDVGSPATGIQVQASNPDSYAAYSAASPYTPVRFDATVSGLGPGQWIAVALNGVVAGTGRTYESEGATRLALMIDPSLLNEGPNDVSYYLVEDGRLRPIS
jgi:hypothetical protein